MFLLKRHKPIYFMSFPSFMGGIAVEYIRGYIKHRNLYQFKYINGGLQCKSKK